MSGCDKKQNTDIIQEFSNAEKDHAISIDIKKEERDEIQNDDTIQPQNNDVNDVNDVNDENSIIENRLDNYKKWFILSHPESASEDDIKNEVLQHIIMIRKGVFLLRFLNTTIKNVLQNIM